MLKHAGLFNAQKVIIVLHKLEGQEHMSLVLICEKLPPQYAKSVFECLNSPEGQASKDLASILETKQLPDGRNLGKVLHTEGHFKKVPNNQLFATPDQTNKIRVSELNELTSKIAEGGDALKRLEELDANKGMHRNKKGIRTMSDESLQDKMSKLNLSDPATVFNELTAQSEKLRKAADALIRDAELMEEKAFQLQKATAPVKVKKPLKKVKVAE